MMHRAAFSGMSPSRVIWRSSSIGFVVVGKGPFTAHSQRQARSHRRNRNRPAKQPSVYSSLKDNNLSCKQYGSTGHTRYCKDRRSVWSICTQCKKAENIKRIQSLVFVAACSLFSSISVLPGLSQAWAWNPRALYNARVFDRATRREKWFLLLISEQWRHWRERYRRCAKYSPIVMLAYLKMIR